MDKNLTNSTVLKNIKLAATQMHVMSSKDKLFHIYIFGSYIIM